MNYPTHILFANSDIISELIIIVMDIEELESHQRFKPKGLRDDLQKKAFDRITTLVGEDIANKWIYDKLLIQPMENNHIDKPELISYKEYKTNYDDPTSTRFRL